MIFDAIKVRRKKASFDLLMHPVNLNNIPRSKEDVTFYIKISQSKWKNI